jgi:phosphatidylglycerophosphatase A
MAAVEDRQVILARHKVWRDPYHFLAFGFGSGLAKFAPGTFGTLAAIPVYLLLVQMSWPVYAGITIAAFFAGIIFCQKTTEDLGVHDFSGIVWDEFVGFWITMFLVPLDWRWVILGFFLFRFFDVVKPWPIAFFDKHVQGGFGIMFDDVVAGLYAWICLYLFVNYLDLSSFSGY